MISTQDLLVILAIAAVLFGAKRLPELGAGIGKAISSFKKGLNEPSEADVTPTKGEMKEEQKSVPKEELKKPDA